MTLHVFGEEYKNVPININNKQIFATSSVVAFMDKNVQMVKKIKFHGICSQSRRIQSASRRFSILQQRVIIHVLND